MIHKYLVLIRRTISTTLEYRASVLIWILTSVTPLVMLAVWSSMAESGPIAGYAQADFVSYFLLLAVVRQMTNAWVAWQLDGEIRNGSLAARLLQPFNPFHAYVAENLADKVVRTFFLIPLFLLGLLLFPMASYETNVLTGVLFVVALLGAWSIHFLSQFVFGLLSFWVSSSQTWHEIWFASAMLLGGMLAPLDMFPPAVAEVARFLPFRYMLSFPVEALLGKLSTLDMLFGVGVAFVWVAALFALHRLLWRSGLKQFGAFGG